MKNFTTWFEETSDQRFLLAMRQFYDLLMDWESNPYSNEDLGQLEAIGRTIVPQLRYRAKYRAEPLAMPFLHDLTYKLEGLYGRHEGRMSHIFEQLLDALFDFINVS